jgi:hypothetical protein
MSIDAALRALEEQLDPLDRVVRLFSASLDPPVLVDDREGRVYRYRAPDIESRAREGRPMPSEPPANDCQ